MHSVRSERKAEASKKNSCREPPPLQCMTRWLSFLYLTWHRRVSANLGAQLIKPVARPDVWVSVGTNRARSPDAKVTLTRCISRKKTSISLELLREPYLNAMILLNSTTIVVTLYVWGAGRCFRIPQRSGFGNCNI